MATIGKFADINATISYELPSRYIEFFYKQDRRVDRTDGASYGSA